MYGGKLALHKYNDLVTYWKDNKDAGLKRIVDSALGKMQTDVLEKLARNAYLAHARKFIGDGSLTGFDQISGSTYKMSTAIIRAIHLGMAERDVAYANNPAGQESAIFCVTTPGVIDEVMNAASTGDWLDVQRYANPRAIVNNEQGTWKGVRFIKSNNACLYNCGTKVVQPTITAAVSAGAGADDSTTGGYLGVYSVGQPSGVTKYITVSSVASLAVGQLVAIHKTRTNANGVTGGVDFTEGSLEYRIIRKISGLNISFDKPIMEDFTTDLGSGVYGYVTLAKNIHTATFIGGPGGVALGVGIPPELHTPGNGEGQLPIIDDVAGMHRFSWDGYLAYAPYTPEVFEVWIGAGQNRIDFGAVGY